MQHTSSMSLLNVKQEKGEYLRAFMDKFNNVSMSIRNLMPELAMHHLVSAIRSGRFTESLIKRPAKDLDELRNRTTKFMQIEEHTNYHKSIRSEKGEKAKEKDRGNRPISGRSDRFRENRGPRFLNYTPLTAPRGRILDKELQAELIPALWPSQIPQNVVTSKHCQYHRNYDHTTEGCQALNDRIEELIQAGHLRKFIKIDTNSYRSPQREATYLGVVKNNTIGVDEKAHVVLMTTSVQQSIEEEVRA